MRALTSLNVNLQQLVRHRSRRQLPGGMRADHRIALLANAWTTYAPTITDNTLHPVRPVYPSGAHRWNDIGYFFCFRETLRILHHQPCHGNSATRTKVPGGLIMFVQLDQPAWPYHILCIARELIVIGELGKLRLEMSHARLQSNYIVAVDLLAFGGVKVFANGA